VTGAPILAVKGLRVHYGAIEALRGISLEVPAGQVVALIGANGAGKTTTLRAISKMLRPSAGTVTFDGADVTRLPSHAVVARGMAHAPEGRGIFLNLTVKENLDLGAYLRRDRDGIAQDAGRAYALFPILAERRAQPATQLSGGQQQMCAIGRALMADPRVLLCDEISLGLAPIVVRDIYARLPQITAEGLSLIIVEQDIVQALRAASHVYCLQEGRVALQGPARDLTREKISAAYFGV